MKKKQNGKLWNRMLSLVVALAILLTALPAQQVWADATIASAQDYTLGSTQNGIFTENGNEREYYKFILPSSGRIDIKGMCHFYGCTIYVYDTNANEIWNEGELWNSTSEVISIDETLFLTAGTYYFEIERYSSSYGNYNFSIDFTSANVSIEETNGGTNNSYEEASRVQVNGATYIGLLAKNDDKDFYTFTLTESGCVNFKATFEKMLSVYWMIYDESGNELLSRNPSWNRTTENITVDEDIYLTIGTYFLAVKKNGWFDDREKLYGVYDFDLNFTSAGESNAEGNGNMDNDIFTANVMNLGTSYKGQLALNDEKDFYQFTLTSPCSVNIKLTAYMQYVYLKLYDAQGKEKWDNGLRWNDTTKSINLIETKSLDAGKYYLSVSRNLGVCGNYTISVDTKSTTKDQTSSGNIDNTSSTKKYTQIINVRYVGARYSAKALKKKKKTFSIGATAQGKITYSVAKGSRYISVNKSGKVTVRKGTPKGTYKVVVTAAATSTYKKATKVIKIIVS